VAAERLGAPGGCSMIALTAVAAMLGDAGRKAETAA
jgi:hypothetical protein